MQTLEKKLAQAVWIAHSLFERGKTSGTTANISFRHGAQVWISASGTCLGTLTEHDFVPVDVEGPGCTGDEGKRPSKELPLHLCLYQNSSEIQAVIHTHAPNAVLWSCLEQNKGRDVLPCYTPYLDMKLGKVVAVPYAPPGSEELFRLMYQHLGPERGYLLSNHGPVVGGYSLMNAFEGIEELEQSAWLAWQLTDQKAAAFI